MSFFRDHYLISCDMTFGVAVPAGSGYPINKNSLQAKEARSKLTFVCKQCGSKKHVKKRSSESSEVCIECASKN